MRTETFSLSHLTLTLYIPKHPASITYIIQPEEVVRDAVFLAEECRTVLCAISGADWTRDLPPWDAPRIFKAEGDFHGGADAFLSYLLGQVLPEVEARAGLTYPTRYLLGISLSGLFALYAGCHTDAFTGLASISGSLWFDGWVEYMTSHRLSPTVQSVYLSLGDKEKHARNPRIRRVEDCTRETEAILKARGIPTVFELNPGNHFVDGALRLEKAVRWLLKSSEKGKVKSEKCPRCKHPSSPSGRHLLTEATPPEDAAPI